MRVNCAGEGNITITRNGEGLGTEANCLQEQACTLLPYHQCPGTYILPDIHYDNSAMGKMDMIEELQT